MSSPSAAAPAAFDPKSRVLTLGHSPDADDAFMFWALAKDKVDAEGYRFEHILQDIETLNRRAEKEELDITAVSGHAYAYLADRFALLPCGASMGDGYGPMVVVKKGRAGRSREDLRRMKIAIPGPRTSAFLALRLYLGDFEFEHVHFDQIPDAVAEGRADAGLIIHESQLTYEAQGLDLVVDLGVWWGEETGGLPLPLGFNVARRALGAKALSAIARVLKRSIAAGLDHRKEALGYAMGFGRGLETADADKFVGMYVNQLTLDLGDRGREAYRRFLHDAHARGYIPNKIVPEFVSYEQ